MFDKVISYKQELLEVIEALDKLGKNYVITKSQKIYKSVLDPEYTVNVWHVKEV